MNFLTKALLSIAAILTIAISTIQAEESQLTTEEQIQQLATTVAELKAELAETKSQIATQATTKKEPGLYVPTVYGVVSTSFAVSGYDGATRFNVRNARLGVKGNATRDMSYVMQIDFHNQGSISVLDAYVRYKRSSFDVTMGQQHIHLSTELDRGPNSFIVNSRSYASILSTAYYTMSEDGSYATDSFGSRDIGVYGNYYLPTKLPVAISAGVFNGLGINEVAWTQTKNYTTRVMIGSSKGGLYGGGSYYWGNSTFGQDVNIITTELSYKSDNVFVEGIYQQRRLQEDGLQLMQFGVVQGYYKFKLNNSKIFDNISPTFRWDCGDDMQYSNLVSETLESYSVNRLTPQLNIGFAGEKIRSRLGISFEKIIANKTPSDIASNQLYQDKFTIALIAAF